MLLTGREAQLSYDVIILFVMIINPHSKKDTAENLGHLCVTSSPISTTAVNHILLL
jgi:hypothetical protein